MGASSGGCAVKSAISGQAKELDGAGDDAGKIRQAIQPGMCCMDDALGTYVGTMSAPVGDTYVGTMPAPVTRPPALTEY
ncbi:hypothetical protein [Streptomyces puniciscabiei]|uniref:hypothetical protein n=1 Tax=Streptomyces puniciscabiei TaxID=164348 RepID=UPI003330D638